MNGETERSVAMSLRLLFLHFCYHEVMTEHNKLVRDKIPEIIRAHGETPHTHTIEDDEEYLRALFAKQREEALELEKDCNLGELADNLEVIRAIAKTLGFTPEQIEEARQEKYDARGGFDKRIFLEYTE